MYDTELQSYMKLIKDHAWVALKKLKKPSTYDHEDLVNEGITLFLFTKQKLYSTNKGASFRTFFTKLLRNHFYDIITKSYSPSSYFCNDTWKETYMNHLRRKSDRNPSKQAHTNLLLSKLTSEEKTYATEILLSHHRAVSRKRKKVRKLLQISIEDEERIRMSILGKLQD